jgi:hypothetical protein
MLQPPFLNICPCCYQCPYTFGPLSIHSLHHHVPGYTGNQRGMSSEVCGITEFSGRVSGWSMWQYGGRVIWRYVY